MTIGEKLSARRKELGLTLENVGNAVGVGKSTVKKWESGYIANMRRDKISALAKILQISPIELIGSDVSNFDIDTNKPSKESQAYDIINECFGKQAAELVHLFSSFNEEGKEKLLDTAADMSQLDRYKKYTEKHIIENNDVKYVIQAARDGEPLGTVETTSEEETKLTNTPLLNFDL